MKAFTLLILLSALSFIMIRGVFHLLTTPFRSAHCEAD